MCIYIYIHIYMTYILHILYSYVVFFKRFLFKVFRFLFTKSKKKNKSEAFTFLLHLIVGQVNLLALKKKTADFWGQKFLPPFRPCLHSLYLMPNKAGKLHTGVISHLPNFTYHPHLKKLSISDCILSSPPKCKTVAAKIEMFSDVHPLKAWRNPGNTPRPKNSK